MSNQFFRAVWMEAFYQRTQRFEAPASRHDFRVRFGWVARRMFPVT